MKVEKQKRRKIKKYCLNFIEFLRHSLTEKKKKRVEKMKWNEQGVFCTQQKINSNDTFVIADIFNFFCLSPRPTHAPVLRLYCARFWNANFPDKFIIFSPNPCHRWVKYTSKRQIKRICARQLYIQPKGLVRFFIFYFPSSFLFFPPHFGVLLERK